MSDDKRLVRIEDKLDSLSVHLGAIDTTLALQHESLKQHMRRSDLLERKLEPVEKHVTFVQNIMKFGAGAGILASIVSTVLKIMKMI